MDAQTDLLLAWFITEIKENANKGNNAVLTIL